MEPVSNEMLLEISELMDTLIINVNSFICQFDSRAVRMRRIVRDFQEIADKFRKMQEKSNRVRTAVAVGAGVAVIIFVGLIGLLFAPITGGLSLVLTVLAAAAGGVAVICANITKTMKERNAERVENLGEDLMSIIKPMKRNLEKIKTVCEEMKLKSFEVQAEQTLNDMDEFIMITTISMINMREERRGASLETFLILSADQCEKVINELRKMKDKVKVFTEQ